MIRVLTSPEARALALLLVGMALRFGSIAIVAVGCGPSGAIVLCAGMLVEHATQTLRLGARQAYDFGGAP